MSDKANFEINTMCISRKFNTVWRKDTQSDAEFEYTIIIMTTFVKVFHGKEELLINLMKVI